MQAISLCSWNREYRLPNECSAYQKSCVSLTAILIQRFLIHLQAANRRTLDRNGSSDVQSSHNMTTIVFDRVVGSLSKSLGPEDYTMWGSLETSHDSDTVASRRSSYDKIEMTAMS